MSLIALLLATALAAPDPAPASPAPTTPTTPTTCTGTTTGTTPTGTTTGTTGSSAGTMPAATTATAMLESKSNSKVTGTATLTQSGKDMKATVELMSAPPGEHAVHIHQKGDCSSTDGMSSGDAYAQGNLGVVKVGNDGKGRIETTTQTVALDKTLGMAVVVYEKADAKATSKRLACGVLKSGSPTSINPMPGTGTGTGSGMGTGTGTGTPTGSPTPMPGSPTPTPK